MVTCCKTCSSFSTGQSPDAARPRIDLQTAIMVTNSVAAGVSHRLACIRRRCISTHYPTSNHRLLLSIALQDPQRTRRLCRGSLNSLASAETGARHDAQSCFKQPNSNAVPTCNTPRRKRASIFSKPSIDF
jgi:hypothetical protein